MKKLAALILALALCAGLCIPAFAEFPTDEAEVVKKFSLTTDMDEYDSYVEEDVVLYGNIIATTDYRDWDDYNTADENSYVKYKGYRIISSDSKITFANTGTGDDYFVTLIRTAYKKDNQGRWVAHESNAFIGESLRQGGFFESRAVFESWSGNPDPYEDFIVELKEGESYTFDASILAGYSEELKSDTMYLVSMIQYYPDLGLYWYQKFLLYVDDAKADEIRAAGKIVTRPPEKTNPFTDVAKDAYYYDAVLWALENNVTTGTTATTFSPNATCTRGQVVTFLWRAAGCPEPTTTKSPFTDVTEDAYYYKPILWAVEQGITTGTSATTFSPGDTCTSGHVVTFLWRFNGKPAAENDGAMWYSEAVAWANAQKLLEGMGKAFDPTATSPRADIVTYLYRTMNK